MARANNIQSFRCKARSAEHSMRITVGYGDPARGQARKLLRGGASSQSSESQWRRPGNGQCCQRGSKSPFPRFAKEGVELGVPEIRREGSSRDSPRRGLNQEFARFAEEFAEEGVEPGVPKIRRGGSSRDSPIREFPRFAEEGGAHPPVTRQDPAQGRGTDTHHPPDTQS